MEHTEKSPIINTFKKTGVQNPDGTPPIPTVLVNSGRRLSLPNPLSFIRERRQEQQHLVRTRQHLKEQTEQKIAAYTASHDMDEFPLPDKEEFAHLREKQPEHVINNFFDEIGTTVFRNAAENMMGGKVAVKDGLYEKLDVAWKKDYLHRMRKYGDDAENLDNVYHQWRLFEGEFVPQTVKQKFLGKFYSVMDKISFTTSLQIIDKGKRLQNHLKKKTDVASSYDVFKSLEKKFGRDATAEFCSAYDAVVLAVRHKLQEEGQMVTPEMFSNRVQKEWETDKTHRNRKLGYNLGPQVNAIFDQWMSHDQGVAYTSTVNKITKKIEKAAGSLADGPILYQMQQDISSAIEKFGGSENVPQDTVLRIMTDIGEQYGISPQENIFVNNPKILKNLKDSFVLNKFVYTRARDVIGWGAYGALLTSPQFRDAVDKYGIGVAMAATGLLVGTMATRVALESRILKEVGFSPDLLATGVAIGAGKLDEEGKLQMQATRGVATSVISDVTVSMMPPFNAALLTNPPYSIPAYIGAVMVDQLVFLGVNAGFWGYKRARSKMDEGVLQPVTKGITAEPIIHSEESQITV